MDERIQNFLKNQILVSLSCLNEQGFPHCFTCYYSYDDKKQRILFKSSGNTRHEKHLRERPELAGTIHPDEVSKVHILGAQIKGTIHRSTDMFYLLEAGTLYHLKNPAALALPGVIWVLHLHTVELTDSMLGIGQRLKWHKEDAQSD
ncbi:MAG: pyridoxamine 5'-phosphate oxidase family protein [Chitinophagaceae bacterium]|nr:pyridoxamine 5'-phosphate oxidase family protein [Chitinophagaceae bacterium]